MKHRWTNAYRPTKSLSPRERELFWSRGAFSRAQRRHCVQCGATHTLANPGKTWHTLKTYFTPLGGIHQHITRMPPCEGLPANYDPPVGA